MNPNDPMFWVMVVIALSFILITVSMIAIAISVSRAVKSVTRLEQKLEPLIDRVTVISEQGKQIAIQGKQIAEQFSDASAHLSTATLNLSESLAIIRDEVGELKVMVSETAGDARDKVEMVSRTIDRTHSQCFHHRLLQRKVVEPARELAAIMRASAVASKFSVAPMPSP